jgi:hypothetical protein
MFDYKQEIGLSLDTDQGRKKVAVRYPTDAEWITWRRKKKILQKDLGRGNFQMEPSVPGAPDMELLNAIRVDKDDPDAPQIDESEAFEIITKLGSADVNVRPSREESGYRIELKVMQRFNTIHRLKIPSVKDKQTYNRSKSSVTYGQYGYQEIRINYQAGADLYDKLITSKEGYSAEVPINHKAEVINVLLQEIAMSEQQEAAPEDSDLDG